MDLLSEIRIVLLGSRTAGKSTAGNTILGKEDFDLRGSAQCVKRQGEVAGRKITVVEAPGWRKYIAKKQLLRQKIVRSVSMCPPGPHAVLLVMRLDCSSWESEKKIFEDCMSALRTKRVWSHAIVLLTCKEWRRDQPIEEYIACQKALQWLIEKCGNRYHVFNYEKRKNTQVTELLEKIERMVAENSGCHLEIEIIKKDVNKKSKKKEERMAKFMIRTKESKQGKYRKSLAVSRIPMPVLPLKASSSSFSTLKTHSPQHSADTKLPLLKFTANCSLDEYRDKYRILWLPAGQFKCKFSNLVFKMKGEVKVLYGIASWNRCHLDALGQKQPAGPLYSIKCLEGSIHLLHLPHCETRKDLAKLTVAHVTGDNVEIIQPLKVTNTHVIIEIQHLSLFSILKEWLFQAHPIKAQVLLFYEREINKLDIHLVPGNVPVEEVKKTQKGKTYIKTSSKCNLTPGEIYRPCCKATECDHVSQPEHETFDCDFGPNHHPTYEVILGAEVKKVTLSLLDEKGQEVWMPRVVFLTGITRTSLTLDSTGADFVDNHREELIQRLPSVMEIADRLIGKEMISNEMYSSIKMKETPQDKMRELYTCLDSGGRSVKAEFYKILREKALYIVDDLSQA